MIHFNNLHSRRRFALTPSKRHLQILMLLLMTLLRVDAGCKTYWEGTAPFCNDSCPKGCRATGVKSQSGNGGTCWTGNKQLCECCGSWPDERPCQPTHTTTTCVVAVLICHNVVTDVPYIECGSYACGACFGSSALGILNELNHPIMLPSNYHHDLNQTFKPEFGNFEYTRVIRDNTN